MMEHDQERECGLSQAASTGDANALNELLSLYERDALRKAWTIYAKYSTDQTVEELQQALMENIRTKSIPKYNPDRNVPFVKWVYLGWRHYRIGIPKVPKENKPKSISIDGNLSTEGSFTGHDWISDPTDYSRSLIARDFAETLFELVEAELPEQQEAVLDTIVGTKCPFKKRVGLALLSRQMTSLPNEQAMRYHRSMNVFERRYALRKLASLDLPMAGPQTLAVDHH